MRSPFDRLDLSLIYTPRVAKMEFEKFDLEVQIQEDLPKQTEWYELDPLTDLDTLDKEAREKLIKLKFTIQNL